MDTDARGEANSSPAAPSPAAPENLHVNSAEYEPESPPPYVEPGG